MATRGTYNFFKSQEDIENEEPIISIYKHWDNYPTNSKKLIEMFVNSKYSNSLNCHEIEVLASNFLHFLKLEEGVDTTITILSKFEPEEYNYNFLISKDGLKITYNPYHSNEQFELDELIYY